MKTKPLRNGVPVSEMGLGTMMFGTKVSSEMSQTLLDLYVEAGGTFLDTANMYAHFYSDEAQGKESETVIGEWMAERKNREEIFLATKVGVPYPGVERGLTRTQIFEECEKSLKRLQTDVIDLYYGHFDDRKVPLEEVLESFQILKEQGKMKHIAASNTRSWRLERATSICAARGWEPHLCVQDKLTYLYPKGEPVTWPRVTCNQDLLDYCTEENLPVVAYGALRKGAYATGDEEKILEYAGVNGITRFEALKQVSEEVGLTPNQVVLAWMLQSTRPVIIPLITASRPEQLQESLDAGSVALSPEMVERLDQSH